MVTAHATQPLAAASAGLAVGDDLSGQVLSTVKGAPLSLPDPLGRVVILELIRSADW